MFFCKWRISQCDVCFILILGSVYGSTRKQNLASQMENCPRIAILTTRQTFLSVTLKCPFRKCVTLKCPFRNLQEWRWKTRKSCYTLKWGALIDPGSWPRGSISVHGEQWIQKPGNFFLVGMQKNEAAKWHHCLFIKHISWSDDINSTWYHWAGEVVQRCQFGARAPPPATWLMAGKSLWKWVFSHPL